MPILDQKIAKMQQELFETFKHLSDENQLTEVKSLLNFYFKDKLDKAISKAELENNYTNQIYQRWLLNRN